MKKLFTFFKATTLLLLILCASSAQGADYLTCGLIMNPFTRTFEYLPAGIPVDDIETDDGFYNNIPLGFTFHFGTCSNKSSYTTVAVSSNGFLRFGSLGGSFPNPTTSTSNATTLPGIWPLWADLSGAGGQASYSTEILPGGTKVFTMEWKNWKWDNTSTSASISFQVKLYEGSDIIELCYKHEAGTPSVAASKVAQVGMGRSVGPSSSSTTCGSGSYDWTEFLNSPTAYTWNNAGALGPANPDRPDDNQVFQFYQKCCSKPEAGEITQPDSVCAGAPFTAKATGATPSPFAAYGITYQWQAAPSATGPWADILPATDPSFTFATGITHDTFLRFIVKCSESGLLDTTLVKHITLIQLPYNCYCYSAANNDPIKPSLVNIGRFVLSTVAKDTLIDTGTNAGLPTFANKGPWRDYTLRTGIRPIPELNRDTTYNWAVMGITSDSFAITPTGVAIYIDFDADGTYNPTTELGGFQVLSGTTTKFTSTFTVPTTAVLDTTGMRIVMKKGATSPADITPCDGFLEGETEDYLVQITYPKCSGPLLAGTAVITDTSICPGYSTTIWDTSHVRYQTGMYWQWEYSLDNVNWADVASGRNVDSLQPVVRQSTYYRLRTVCEISKDTIFSNKVYIKLKQPYKCYCYSLADGNDGNNHNDTADISTVEIDKFVMNTGGPHLMNVNSIRMRTDYTDLSPIELVAGKRYPIAVYHTLFTKLHSDARITVFMDFNHDLAYGAAERVWNVTTSASNYFIHDSITIPVAVIPDEPLGMRVILNSNTLPNDPSDLGCGAYTSGETEDYLVIFRRPSTGISEMTNINNLMIYPNPNNGVFTVSFGTTTAVNEANITVTNITGQKVFTEQYTNISSSFSRNINLAGQASGVYFITLSADGQNTVQKVLIH